MTEQKFFRPDQATEPFPPGTTDNFPLQACLPKPERMMDENFAIVVLMTFEDQRVGTPWGIRRPPMFGR